MGSVALLVLAAGLAAPDDPGPLAARQEAVATVDGKAIRAGVYRMFVRNGAAALGLRASGEEGRRRLEEAVLEELVDRALIEAEAQRRGLAVPEEAVTERLARYASRMGDGLRASLEENGLLEADFRALVVQELAGERLREELTKGVTAPEADLRQGYAAARRDPSLAAALLVVPETVTASHILVEARPRSIEQRVRAERGLRGDRLAAAVGAEREALRREAEELRRRALLGEDFAELARRFSGDAPSRGRGGDLGSFPRGTHTPSFDDAAFSLAEGSVGPVVETEYGFHVLRVARRAPERLRTFEEARPLLEERLLARKRAERLREWLAARRREARIVRPSSVQKE